MFRTWILAGSATLLLLFVLFPLKTTASHYSRCGSSTTSNGGVLLVCPSGDGPTLADIGATISVRVVDMSYYPVEQMPATDFWITSLAYYDVLCTGSGSSNADAPTDANGETTMSGSLAAGGYFGDGVYVVVQGTIIQCCEDCNNPLPLVLVSPDINGDLAVESADFVLFAAEFSSGGGTPDPRMDFNGDGLVESVDFALFAQHFSHECPYLPGSK